MKNVMQRAVKEFVDLLRRRLDAGVFTTEDSVRFTFYAALLDSAVRPEQVILEYAHPLIQRARIDTVVLETDQSPRIAVEFKYDRANPSRTNQPMPQKAGAAFADLIRLLKLPWQVERYLVYVTDGELAGYLMNRRNGLSEVFGLKEGTQLQLRSDFFSGRSVTFLEAMGKWPGPAILSCIASRDFPQDHHLRIYEIRPGNIDSQVTQRISDCFETDSSAGIIGRP